FGCSQVASSSEGHEIWESCGLRNAHRCSTLEIGRNQQRRLCEMLHVVDEGRHLEWLRGNYTPVATAARHDEPTYVILSDPPLEGSVLCVIRRRIISVTTHNKELSDAV